MWAWLLVAYMFVCFLFFINETRKTFKGDYDEYLLRFEHAEAFLKIIYNTWCWPVRGIYFFYRRLHPNKGVN